MTRRTKSRPKTVVTTMRLPADVCQAASRKAEALCMSRARYIERLLRRDLGMERRAAKTEDMGILG